MAKSKNKIPQGFIEIPAGFEEVSLDEPQFTPQDIAARDPNWAKDRPLSLPAVAQHPSTRTRQALNAWQVPFQQAGERTSGAGITDVIKGVLDLPFAPIGAAGEGYRQLPRVVFGDTRGSQIAGDILASPFDAIAAIPQVISEGINLGTKGIDFLTNMLPLSENVKNLGMNPQAAQEMSESLGALNQTLGAYAFAGPAQRGILNLMKPRPEFAPKTKYPKPDRQFIKAVKRSEPRGGIREQAKDIDLVRGELSDMFKEGLSRDTKTSFSEKVQGKIKARQDALWNVETEAIGRHPNEQIIIEPEVANRILEIGKELKSETKYAELKNMVQNGRNTMSIGEARQLLVDLNADAAPLYQIADKMGEFSSKAEKAIATELKDYGNVIRDKYVDRLEQLGESGVRDVRKTWGALDALHKDIGLRKNDIDALGADLVESNIQHGYASPRGHIAGSILQLLGKTPSQRLGKAMKGWVEQGIKPTAKITPTVRPPQLTRGTIGTAENVNPQPEVTRSLGSFSGGKTMADFQLGSQVGNRLIDAGFEQTRARELASKVASRERLTPQDMQELNLHAPDLLPILGEQGLLPVRGLLPEFAGSSIQSQRQNIGVVKNPNPFVAPTGIGMNPFLVPESYIRGTGKEGLDVNRWENATRAVPERVEYAMPEWYNEPPSYNMDKPSGKLPETPKKIPPKPSAPSPKVQKKGITPKVKKGSKSTSFLPPVQRRVYA